MFGFFAAANIRNCWFQEFRTEVAAKDQEAGFWNFFVVLFSKGAWSMSSDRWFLPTAKWSCPHTFLFPRLDYWLRLQNTRLCAYLSRLAQSYKLQKDLKLETNDKYANLLNRARILWALQSCFEFRLDLACSWRTGFVSRLMALSHSLRSIFFS